MYCIILKKVPWTKTIREKDNCDFKPGCEIYLQPVPMLLLFSLAGKVALTDSWRRRRKKLIAKPGKIKIDSLVRQLV